MSKIIRLATIVKETKGQWIVRCPHCRQLNFMYFDEGEEVDRNYLNEESAQVAINEDCHHCLAPFQINTVVKKSMDRTL